MSFSHWYNSISDAFKKRAGRYLINRYLGTFLDETISLDQLSIDGAISLNNVALNIRTINSMIDEADLPVEFVDGYIQDLSVTIPWSNLLNESCFFCIDGLTITLQVKKRANPAQISASIFHSMCESFSSFHVAEDCFKQGDVESSPGKTRRSRTEEDMVAGVELLAQAIDSVIMRVQVRLTNTVVRLEYLPVIEQQGLAVELHVGKLEYRGQAGQEEDSFSTSTLSKINFEDVSIYTDEFDFNTRKSMYRSQCLDTSQHNEDAEPPLPLGILEGRQELLLKFTEMNQFGLPRAVDELQLNLGALKLHVFPHQVHILTEIVSAITVPAKPSPGVNTKHNLNRQITDGLEELLQDNLRFAPENLGLNMGWGDDMSNSVEFKPLTKLSSSKGFLLDGRTGSPPPSPGSASPPMPRICIRIAGIVAVLKERDPGIRLFHGEASKTLALRVMQNLSSQFFDLKTTIPTSALEGGKVMTWHSSLAAQVQDSHIQLVGAPINIVYEEGTAIGSGLTSSYAAITKVTIGQLSIAEALIPCDSREGTKHEIIQLLQFSLNIRNSPSARQKKNPDFRLIYKDTFSCEPEASSPISRITIDLNPCSLQLDPGLYDRIILLVNYKEMDPDCIRTPESSGQHEPAYPETTFILNMNSPKVEIKFQIPKPDMRLPSEVEDYLRLFWTRKVHPEVYTLTMDAFNFRLEQEKGSSFLELCLAAQSLEADYRDCESSNPFPLLVTRRLLSSCAKHEANNAIMTKSVMERKNSSDPETDNYFMIDPDTGCKDVVTKSLFIKQLKDIMAALNQSLLRNNILVDIEFEAVSLVIPSKHLYEIIFNRFGNDMLLWLPAYLTVKEHIYGEKVVNLLEDDTAQFSSEFASRSQYPQVTFKEPVQEPITNTNAFPKDLKTDGPLEIHTDTAVSLTVKQVQLLLCLPMESSTGCDQLGLLHVSAVDLRLLCAAGLDPDPEISLVNVQAGEGCVRYGLVARDGGLPAQLHFNTDLADTFQVLLTTNSYSDKAWLEPPAQTELLNVTIKTLFDRRTNLKSIQMGCNVNQGGLCVRDPSTAQGWINALVDFFRVVEFPVLGYNPPVVLTEMHFLLNHCAVELSPTRNNIISFKSRYDACVDITVEDASFFVSADAVNPVHSAICVADLDFLDIIISISEPDEQKEESIQDLSSDSKENTPQPIAEPNLSVTGSCNLIRLRTCVDTLQLVTTVLTGFTPPESEANLSAAESGGDEEESSFHPGCPGSEASDVLPELEDAMVEEMETKQDKANTFAGSRSSEPRHVGSGAQVFFFPDEGGSPPSMLPPSVGTAGIIQHSPSQLPSRHCFKLKLEDNSDLESFCILEDEEGCGIVSKSGEPVIRVLNTQDGGINIQDNYFQVPQENIDYLKAPSGFPQPQVKLALKRVSILWQIFGGNDLSTSKDMKCNTKARLQKMGAMSTLADGEDGCHKRSAAANSRAQIKSGRRLADSLKTAGGPGRNEDVMIEVYVHKMAAQHETYPLVKERNAPVSRQILLVPSLEVRDRLVDSEINKLLHVFSNKTRPRQSSAHMISLKDTLFFLIDFANSLAPGETDAQPGAANMVYRENTPPLQETGVIKYRSGMQAIQLEIPEGTEIFEDARSSPPKKNSIDSGSSEPLDDSFRPRSSSKSSTPGPSCTSGASTSSSNNSLYFKSFKFSPAVPIRIDYVGKYVDLTQGALTGILAGLAQLNCSEITLKELEFRQGVLGIDKLLALAATAWLADIRSSQLPALLGGVGPMHALLQMVNGLKDLFFLPIEQYRKDGRIVRGLQRGTNSFTHSTSLSILEVTSKLLTVVKFAAELAFDVMSPEGCVVQGKLPHPTQYCRRRVGRAGLRRARGTPQDLREGMMGAMALVREGLDETARSLALAASHRDGMSGAVGGVLRAVPSTMVRPLILGAAATTNLLDGVKNQISPDQRLEEEEKWKTHST